MMATRRLVVAVLVLGLAACGGSSKPSDSTTRTSTRTSATIPRIKIKLGPCPARYPQVKLATLNARAQSLATKLVPFAPLSARVCSYSLKGLVASGTLGQRAASKLATDTNALAKVSSIITCPTASRHVSHLFLVTFDNAAQRVHLRETDACGGSVTNGEFTAKETRPWAAAVVQVATKKASRPTAATR